MVAFKSALWFPSRSHKLLHFDDLKLLDIFNLTSQVGLVSSMHAKIFQGKILVADFLLKHFRYNQKNL